MTRATDAEETRTAPSAMPELAPEQKMRHDQKTNALRASITSLETQLVEIESELANVKVQLKNDPAATVQRHIRLLHEYNEIKDIGQGLLGLIADARGARQVDVQREFGLEDED